MILIWARSRIEYPRGPHLVARQLCNQEFTLVDLGSGVFECNGDVMKFTLVHIPATTPCVGDGSIRD
jgi:hypothetical protein